jgi:ABC-type uncharacterized transport system ATPase subunit
METILEARGIVMIYEDGVVANRGVSISVERQTIHAVVGENGAGKSTLMKILFGMRQPQEGEILYKGRRVPSAWASAWCTSISCWLPTSPLRKT